MIKLLSLSILTLLFSINPNFGQGNQPVTWLFKTETISRDEIILFAKAYMTPSWHLYSQFIKEGGPQPTRFIFEQSSDYVPIGKTEEKGKQTKFYDDIYEMDIIWYSDEVSFCQKIRLNQPVTVIKGKVEYMTCNNSICVPNMQEFRIDVEPLIKNP